MQKFILISVIGLALLAGLFYTRNSDSPKETIVPEITRVNRHQATVIWTTRDAVQGKVYFRPSGTQAEPTVARENISRAYRHQVTLTGLKPGIRYTYWIDDPDRRYQFQTQPAAADPFSFLAVYGKYADQVQGWVRDEFPEFIIDLNQPSSAATDPFRSVRPYQPIFNAGGPDSRLMDIDVKPAADNRAPYWELDWGGLRILFVNVAGHRISQLNAPGAHTIGIVTSEKIAGLPESDLTPEQAIGQSRLHSDLKAYNQNNPARPAAFVIFRAEKYRQIQVDGITYLWLRVDSDPTGAVRFDVGVDTATAVFLPDHKKLALKTPPLNKKLTCEECRRLADRGSYESAIKAYREFINTNSGHYQVDDALYAIAEIYDEKLFRFSKSLYWYRRLTTEYPRSTLSPLARQRISFFKSYSDFDFEPLTRFERIKKIDFGRKQHDATELSALFRRVEAIVAEYPTARIAPSIQSWLATQLRDVDVEQAVAAFRRLKTRYGNSPQGAGATLAIGDTYYQAGLYPEAETAYRQALIELPHMAETVSAQIRRCKRNMRRDYLAFAAAAILAVACLPAVGLQPLGIPKKPLLRSLLAFVLLSGLISVGAWSIQEQFTSVREMLLLVVCLSAAAAAAGLASSLLSGKCLEKRSPIQSIQREMGWTLLGVLVGFGVLLSGVYLSIYIVNVHYLIVIGL